MTLSKVNKIVLSAYSLLILFMCILYVPNKIIANYSYNDTVKSIYIDGGYYPIWKDFSDISTGGTTIIKKNVIDYARLFTQVFALTVLTGTTLLILNNRKMGDLK